ncbi:MAG: sensor histidine kinase [Vicinamibacterales bacterium]
MLAATALVPLVAFGGWAFLSLQAETRRAVIESNRALVEREANDLTRELSRETAILAALAADVEAVAGGLEPQVRILDNYIMRFPTLRGVTVLDSRGGVLAGRGSAPQTRPEGTPLGESRTVMSPVQAATGQVPSALFAVPLNDVSGPQGWIVADVTFENLWELVEELRVGAHGHATMLDAQGRVIASGAPKAETTLPAGANLSSHPLFGRSGPAWREYTDGRGERQLAVAASVSPTGWLLLLEQPTEEAFGPAAQLGRQLAIAAVAAVLAMLLIGVLLGRRAIAPVHALERATQAVASGDLSARVAVRGDDEFGRLGQSFNAMADRLLAQQTEIKRQERQVIFGRVVAGLLHDINQPIQAIGNGARMLLHADLDEVSRASARQTIDRELETLRRFMDDLLNVARPTPLDRVPVDVGRTLADAAEALGADAERAQVRLVLSVPSALPAIDADPFALGRVYRNLIANAIQATSPAGQVALSVRVESGHVVTDIADTGSGIPPGRLPTLFEDFATTKRRGLGLGLATSRRLVEQLGGTIDVASALGEGTTFTLRFPASSRPAVEAAS